MVDFKDLKDLLISQLEDIQTHPKLYYHIESDTGTYQSPVRDGNEVTEYINGVLTATASDVMQLQSGHTIATQNARLDLIVRLPDLTADEIYNGTSLETVNSKVEEVRSVLTGLTRKTYLDTISNCTISTAYQLAIAGERAIVPNTGDSIVFSVNVFFIIVEGGINARSVVLHLDGINLPIPYQAMTINHSKTYDSNVPANTTTGEVENIPIQSNWSINLELPAIMGDFFNIVYNNVAGNDKLNTVHCLAVTNEATGTEDTFLVTIGETNLNAATVQNVGLKVTFLKARNNYYLVSLPTNYTRYEATDTMIRFGLPTSGFYFFQNGATITPHYIKANSIVAATANIGDVLIVSTDIPLIDGSTGLAKIEE